jgi:hypothetical protein
MEQLTCVFCRLKRFVIDVCNHRLQRGRFIAASYNLRQAYTCTLYTASADEAVHEKLTLVGLHLQCLRPFARRFSFVCHLIATVPVVLCPDESSKNQREI